MNITGSFKDNDVIVTYDISDEQKDMIITRLIEYYSTNGYIGEVIHQDDDAIIDAPSVLSDICDNIIEFKTTNIERTLFDS